MTEWKIIGVAIVAALLLVLAVYLLHSLLGTR